jgi:hypothetical protein
VQLTSAFYRVHARHGVKIDRTTDPGPRRFARQIAPCLMDIYRKRHYPWHRGPVKPFRCLRKRRVCEDFRARAFLRHGNVWGAASSPQDLGRVEGVLHPQGTALRMPPTGQDIFTHTKGRTVDRLYCRFGSRERLRKRERRLLARTVVCPARRAGRGGRGGLRSRRAVLNESGRQGTMHLACAVATGPEKGRRHGV